MARTRKLTPEEVAAIRVLPLGQLPNKVRIALDILDVTQADVAEDIGIAPPNLSNLVNGRYSDVDALTLGTVRAIADYIGAPIEVLFPRTES